MFCTCGNTKIENAELGLCASCNRARRKAHEPKPEKKTYQLKRTPLKKISATKSAALTRKHATQKQMRESGVRWCETCGRSDRPISHSHILSVGQFPEFEDVPENMIYECFGSSDSCHYIYEHGTLEQRMAQSTWQRKVNVILKLKPEYLNRMFLKVEQQPAFGKQSGNVDL